MFLKSREPPDGQLAQRAPRLVSQPVREVSPKRTANPPLPTHSLGQIANRVSCAYKPTG